LKNIKTIISAIAIQSFVIYSIKQKSFIRQKVYNISNKYLDYSILSLEINI